jgi:hypothetical protein
MIDLFIYCYAAISTAAIITGLYFTFTNGGKDND